MYLVDDCRAGVLMMIISIPIPDACESTYIYCRTSLERNVLQARVLRHRQDSFGMRYATPLGLLLTKSQGND
jgi:hypothetical protein